MCKGMIKMFSKEGLLLTSTMKGPEGNKLEHAMGVKTESLDPAHNYVPWVVINGEHTNELESEAMKDLKGLVCKLYTGQKPSECDATNA